jgi:hypothetical protein
MSGPLLFTDVFNRPLKYRETGSDELRGGMGGFHEAGLLFFILTRLCEPLLFSLKHVVNLFDKLYQPFGVLFDGCLLTKF